MPQNQDEQRQRAAEERGIDAVIPKLVEAEPQGGRGCELRVASADPMKGEEQESDGEHAQCAGDMLSDIADRHMQREGQQEEPHEESPRNRLEIVIVKRSEKAA